MHYDKGGSSYEEGRVGWGGVEVVTFGTSDLWNIPA